MGTYIEISVTETRSGNLRHGLGDFKLYTAIQSPTWCRKDSSSMIKEESRQMGLRKYVLQTVSKKNFIFI